jgi:hypothetical protein
VFIDISSLLAEVSSEKTIVIDTGIASEEKIEIIKQKQLKYAAVLRRSTFPEDFWSDSTKKKGLQLYDQNNSLQVKLVKVICWMFTLILQVSASDRNNICLDQYSIF